MERKHDFSDLQWLQQNARVYRTATFILTVFMLFTLCLSFFQPWHGPSPISLAFWRQQDSDEAVADQQAPNKEDNVAEQTPKEQHISGDSMDKQADDNEASIAQHQPVLLEETTPRTEDDSIAQEQANPQAEQIETSEQKTQSVRKEQTEQKQPKVQTIDPQMLAGFVLPCEGAGYYDYGVGYDADYDDYRFHDAICYQADGGAVLAALDGIVQRVDLEAEWQLILQCGNYQLHYSGLQTCDVLVGESVTAGQTIGTAGARCRLQATVQE